MDRRSLLKALGSTVIGGFAGCITRSPGRGTRTSSAGSRTSTRGLNRRIQIVGQDPVPEAYDLTIEATVVHRNSTTRHPATIDITATNTGSTRQIDVGTGRCGPFNRQYGGSSPKGLWLDLTGGDAPQHRRDRWESTRPAGEARGYAAYGCGSGAFPAGESRTTTYGVWSDYQVQAYLEPGTYRFRSAPIRIEDATSTTTTGSSPGFRWGFSIEVSSAPLLTEPELLQTVDRTDEHVSASLYYVDANGSWFQASPNGSIGGPAPNGSIVPHVFDSSGRPEQFHVSERQRPTYLWKVTSADGCSTTFYRASNASVLAPYAIPGCPPMPAPGSGLTTVQ